MIRLVFFTLIILTIYGCDQMPEKDKSPIRFEEISYFKVHNGLKDTRAYKFRYTYFYDNGNPYRYSIIDSSSKVLIDYFYYYDDEWTLTDARYKEEGETAYSIERFAFDNENSTKTTTWLDSSGTVYYTMVESLDGQGRPFVASFTGDELHGYDSIYYNESGFEERIFFTSVSGRKLNDRTFNYTNYDGPEWVGRQKIMGDSIQEIHHRSVQLSPRFYTNAHIYYPATISSFEYDENLLSISARGDYYFITRSNEWLSQTPLIGTIEQGLFMEPKPIDVLGSIYNGAISPSGDQILFCRRDKSESQIWLSRKKGGIWGEPINLTESSELEGGYINWFDDKEIYFSVDDNNGDIVRAQLMDEEIQKVTLLDPINTTQALEFSPFIDKHKRFLIFTRYSESDIQDRGIFISYNSGDIHDPKWGKPVKIEELTYGWGSLIDYASNLFLYSDGKDILAYPIKIVDGIVSFENKS